MNRKPLTIAVLAFIIVLFSAVLLLGDIGLALFNVVFGNEVYALTINYGVLPNSYRGELVGLSFNFDFDLAKTKVPIETILRNYQTTITGESNFSLENRTFTLTLNTLVWTANHIKLFTHTFTFEDVNPRQIIIYLHRLRPSHEEATVEVNGNYVLDGSEVSIKVGDTLEI